MPVPRGSPPWIMKLGMTPTTAGAATYYLSFILGNGKVYTSPALVVN